MAMAMAMQGAARDASGRANAAAQPAAAVIRRGYIPLTDTTINAFSQNVRMDLPQVGIGIKLWVTLFGTIVTGVGAAGNFSANFPFNILSLLSLRTGDSSEVYRTNGWMNILVQSTYNLAFSPAQQGLPVTFASSTTGIRTGVASGPAPSAAITASTTFNILVTYMVPMAGDDGGQAGGLLLQDIAARAFLELTSNNLVGNGGLNGIGSATAALGAGGAISFTVKALYEYDSYIPGDPGQMQQLRWFSHWTQDEQAFVAVGEQVYRPALGAMYAKFLFYIESSGAPYVFFTGSSPNAPAVGNVTMTTSGSQLWQTEDFRTLCAQMTCNYSQTLPDGVFVLDFSIARSVELGLNARNFYNSIDMTEVLIKFQLFTVPTAGRIIVARLELIDKMV